jgi:hypothetical protein
MDDDGGLSSIRTELTTAHAAAEDARVEAEKAVAGALHEQRARVSKAIVAFFRAADEKGIEPEQIVKRRVRQPQPKVRWWQVEPPNVWTPVYEAAYTVHTHVEHGVGDSGDNYQYVILWRSGEVVLEPVYGGRGSSPSSEFDGALPFRIGIGKLEHVSLSSPTVLSELHVKDIHNTVEQFVRWLAEYLEQPEQRGMADRINRTLFLV